MRNKDCVSVKLTQPEALNSSLIKSNSRPFLKTASSDLEALESSYCSRLCARVTGIMVIIS